MAWLYGSFSESTLKSVYGLHSSLEVWSHLARKFNRVSTSRKIELQRRIQSTVKGNKTMTAYLVEIKTLCDQLDSIGSSLTEQEIIAGILSGLGKEYESICTIIEHSMDTLHNTVDDVEFKLKSFDDKLQSYEVSPAADPHLAFYTDKSHYSNTYRGGHSNRRGQNRGGYRGRSSFSTRGRGFSQQFSSSSQSDSRPTCQICGKLVIQHINAIVVLIRIIRIMRCTMPWRQ